MTITFCKYQACGNDFIIIDEDEVGIIPEEDKPRIAQNLCQYHFSIGANGVLYVNQDGENYTFRIFEPDGSESDMCGNGIRCVAAYYFDKARKENIEVRTRNNILLNIRRIEDSYRVNMGCLLPINSYLSTNLPVTNYLELNDILRSSEKIRNILSSIRVRIDQIHMVNIGEPHLVIFTSDIHTIDLVKLGEIAKQQEIFPVGININLVEVVSDSTIRVRTYERGNWNETFSCGTGSCSAASIARMIFFPNSNQINVITNGGNLKVEFIGNDIILNGRAREVFTGENDII